MNKYIYTDAKYVEWKDSGSDSVFHKFILATLDGKVLSIPLDPANGHYAEIMRQVNEGTLTIEPADE